MNENAKREMVARYDAKMTDRWVNLVINEKEEPGPRYPCRLLARSEGENIHFKVIGEAVKFRPATRTGYCVIRVFYDVTGDDWLAHLRIPVAPEIVGLNDSVILGETPKSPPQPEGQSGQGGEERRGGATRPERGHVSPGLVFRSGAPP